MAVTLYTPIKTIQRCLLSDLIKFKEKTAMPSKVKNPAEEMQKKKCNTKELDGVKERKFKAKWRK